MRPLNLILTVKTGPHAGKTHLISAGNTIRVGRTPDSHLAFEADNFMSSVHFEIQNLGDRVEVRDLRSTNKTWVNNTAISAIKLQPGDTVRAGKTTFGFEWDKSKSDVNVASDSGSSLHRRIDALIDEQMEAEPLDLAEKPWSGHIGDRTDPTPRNAILARMQLSNVVHFGEAISELMRNMRRFKNTFIVAHFLKIGTIPPDVLEGECVFDHLGSARDYMPVAIDSKRWQQWVQSDLTDRLSRSDGLAVVLLEDEADYGCLQRIGKQAVPGYSEASGFLGWCWPKQWLGICDELSNREIRELMGPQLFGVIVPDPKRMELRAFVAIALIPALVECGFSICEP